VPHKPAEIEGKPSRTVVRQELEETAEFLWWKTADGVEHPVRAWTATPQTAVILYFHGIESHGRWFEDTALELNKKGITTFAFDRRGCGSSRELRGHSPAWQQWVDDADEILAEVRRRNPATPIFLVANCWGSKIALAVASRPHNSFIGGIAITSPAVCVKVDLSFSAKLRVGLSLLRGGKDYFDIPLTPEHFTDVPLYLDYIRRDPLRLTRATASFFFESIKLDKECQASAAQLQMPLLILQSGRDAIVDVRRIKQWFGALPLADKTLRMFDKATHSLDFDPCAAEYQEALANWILERSNCK
jgi:alpha-beta hydrolase superfamily lysophospholipase